VERRRFARLEVSVNDLQNGIESVPQQVVVGECRFTVTPFEAARIERCGVRGYIGAEQIDGYAEMKIKIPLDGRQVDHPQRTEPSGVVGLVLRHDFARAVDDATGPG